MVVGLVEGSSDGSRVGPLVVGRVVGKDVVGLTLGYDVEGLRVPTIGACDGFVEGARDGAGIPSQQMICRGRNTGPVFALKMKSLPLRGYL